MLRLLERTYISVFRRYPVLLRMALVVLLAEIMFAAVNNYALTFYINNEGFDGLHRPMAVVGDIISVFLIAEMLLKFWAGHLSDRYGRRHFAAIGLAACIGTPLAIIAVPPATFIAAPTLLYLVLGPLRALDGAGSAATWPPLFASVPDHIPSEHRGVAMSVVNSAYLAALALGPALAGAAMKIAQATGHASWSYRAPFIMAILFALLASAVAFTLPAQSTHGQEKKTVSLREALPPVTVILVVLAITFSDMFATGTVAPYIAQYLSRIGRVSPSNVGFLMLLLVAPAGILGMPIGHLTDRMERRRVVQIALAATALGLWGVSLSQNLGQMIATGSLVMLGFMFGLPAWLALITELAPEAGSGKVMGIMATAQAVGAFLGPMVGGRLWDHNPHYPFYVAAGMLTLSSLIALIFIRRRGGESVPVAEEASVSS